MISKPMKRFGICKCFYERNIFVPNWKTHVSFDQRDNFIRNYGPERQDVHEVVNVVEAEVERRKDLHRRLKSIREEVQSSYTPLHKNVYKFDPAFLHPAYRDLIQAVKDDPDRFASDSKIQLTKLSNNITFYKKGAVSIPFFTKEFCNQLVEEVDHFSKSPCPRNLPNTMNQYGINLDDIGLTPMLDELRTRWISPLCDILYPDYSPLDSHKTFTILYDAGTDSKQVHLDPHFDNAEVTLNVALTDEHDGGELVFEGFNTDPDSDQQRIAFGYEHELGHGLIHLGKQIHQALPISSGRRMNLIMWMRSSKVRNKVCPMCGSEPKVEPVETGYGDGFLIE